MQANSVPLDTLTHPRPRAIKRDGMERDVVVGSEAVKSLMTLLGALVAFRTRY